MPYKFHEPQRHHIEKMVFKVTNWSAYDEGLQNRGPLTFWIEDAVLQSWYAAPRTTPGRQSLYADGTIEMILTLRMVYHLPLRQTEGLHAASCRYGPFASGSTAQHVELAAQDA